MQWADSADDKMIFFFFNFFQKIGFDISSKLSPRETICMKCQIPFSGENKKNISKCHLLKFLPSMLSINHLPYLLVRFFFIWKVLIFSYFSMKTYIVGTHWKCLSEVLLVSTHNMFLWRNRKTYYVDNPSYLSLCTCNSCVLFGLS